MKLTFVTLFTAFFATLTGCGSGAVGAEPIEPGASLNAAQFAQAITKPEIVVLDVRTPQEFADAHLADAVNIDVNGPSFQEQVTKLDKSKTYALYCRSGMRSATAMRIMANAGFEHYFHLGGGINEWISAGQPTSVS